MTGLRATVYELGIRSDEARNLGRDEELKKLGIIQDHEDRDEDQGNDMGQNENSGLMCQ